MCKKKPLTVTVRGSHYVPGGNLLSHANAHYHRRNFVSRFCSRWEEVGPKCYGRQAKLGMSNSQAITHESGRSKLDYKNHNILIKHSVIKVIGSSLTVN